MNDARLIAAGRLFQAVGVDRLARSISRGPSVRVTLTHWVRRSEIVRFEALVRYLIASRRPLMPEEFFGQVERGEWADADSFLVTFDDGLRSSYEAARRVLDPLGIKAVFFVPTMILDLDGGDAMRRFAWDRLYRRRRAMHELDDDQMLTMTVHELRELHDRGHCILPHTHSHVRLSEITTEAQARAELERPRLILEDLLNAPAPSMAFPTGTERVVGAYAYDWIRRLYSSCFTALSGANTAQTDRFALYRDSLHPHQPLAHHRRVLGGALDFGYALKMRRLRNRVASHARANA